MVTEPAARSARHGIEVAPRCAQRNALKIWVRRQLDIGLISPFEPHKAQPKWQKFVPREARGTNFCTGRVHVVERSIPDLA
jgi:hypothetical protein